MAEPILVVDSDDIERRRLSAAFEREGFSVVEAASGVEGLFEVLESTPLLILLAEEVPPLEAADLLKVLRRISDAPVIIIGSGGDLEELAALADGADFYARRPFSLGVLLARARALLRRYRGSTGLAAGDQAVRINGSLTPTERRLLVCLAAHDGRPVTAEQLVMEVWAGKASTSSAKFYVSKLRHKLETSGNGPRLVSSWGVGYRLMGIDSQHSQKVARVGQAV